MCDNLLEPAFYQEGQFGVRLENVLEVIQNDIVSHVLVHYLLCPTIHLYGLCLLTHHTSDILERFI